MFQSEKELAYTAFLNREYEFKHSPYEKEFEFYEHVKNGDIEAVKKLMTPLGSGGAGILSDAILRNLKYHFIVTIALVTRFCVEGGMEMETAYTLSDLYIAKVDKAISKEDIHELHEAAIFEFTRKMNKLKRKNMYTKPVVMTMDYIYNNLHSKISEVEIAKHISLSPSYISRLFKKEVGVTMRTYIAMKRVETAQNMLKFSDYSSVDIGNYLAFSSHSHFISVFKKHTGMTPNEFRKKHYRKALERTR